MTPGPGLYHYRLPGWTRTQLAEVTETHARFVGMRPTPLDQIPPDAVFTRLRLDDIPKVADRLFLISIDGEARAAIPLAGPLVAPEEILGRYAEQYGFDVTQLSWSIVHAIPMPQKEDDVRVIG